jgi:hypothetical protein
MPFISNRQNNFTSYTYPTYTSSTPTQCWLCRGEFFLTFFYLVACPLHECIQEECMAAATAVTAVTVAMATAAATAMTTATAAATALPPVPVPI